MHQVLVNRFGGLSLPRKSEVMLTDCQLFTVDVKKQRNNNIYQTVLLAAELDVQDLDLNTDVNPITM